MQDEIKDLAELAGKVLKAEGDDAAKYKDALERGVDAAKKAATLLEGLRDGKPEVVNGIVSEFEEIERTNRAIEIMDEEIEKVGTVQLDDVLAVLKLVATIGIAAAGVL